MQIVMNFSDDEIRRPHEDDDIPCLAHVLFGKPVPAFSGRALTARVVPEFYSGLAVIAGLSRRPRLLRHSAITIEVAGTSPAMTALGSVST
jgi:hypothetical protein